MKLNFYLKALIVEKFRTQVDFAQAVGERESTVSRIVRGRRDLPLERQKVWAKALGVSIEELFTSA